MKFYQSIQRFAFLFLCNVFLCSASSAEDVKVETITLKDGRVFENTTIKKRGENMASIIHSSGILSVPLSELPDDVSNKFGYSHEDATKKQEELLKQIEKDKIELEKSISFKGLRLKMKLVDLPQFFKATLWNFNRTTLELQRLSPKEYAFDLRKPDQTLILSGGSWDEESIRRKGITKEQEKDFYEIGSEGVGNAISSYQWKHAIASFHEGLLAEFEVYGYPVSADELQTKTLKWLALAEKGLRQRYGKPTKEMIPLQTFSILNTESGYIKFLTEWKIEDQTITLGVSTSESQFTPVIVYSDTTLKAKLDNAGSAKPKL